MDRQQIEQLQKQLQQARLLISTRDRIEKVNAEKEQSKNNRFRVI